MRYTVVPDDKIVLREDDTGEITVATYVDLSTHLDVNSINAIQYRDGSLSIEYKIPEIPNYEVSGEEADSFIAPFIELFFSRRHEMRRLHRKVQEDVFNSWDRIRGEREYLISSAEWVVDRHRNEVELGIETTISQSQYVEVLRYFQALRDIPQSQGDRQPKHVVFPRRPKFLPPAPINHFQEYSE